MDALLISIIRTITPLIVGSTAAFFTAGERAELENGLILFFTTVYYMVVRILETYSKRWGILLGWKSSPEYELGSKNGD